MLYRRIPFELNSRTENQNSILQNATPSKYKSFIEKFQQSTPKSTLNTAVNTQYSNQIAASISSKSSATCNQPSANNSSRNSSTNKSSSKYKFAKKRLSAIFDSHHFQPSSNHNIQVILPEILKEPHVFICETTFEKRNSVDQGMI